MAISPSLRPASAGTGVRGVSYGESVTYGGGGKAAPFFAASSAPLSAPATPTFRRPGVPTPLKTPTPTSTSTQRRNQSKTLDSIAQSRQPPPLKKYQPFQSLSIERRAKASTLAIGDTPRRRQDFSVDERFGATSRMSNSDYERYREWVDNVADTPDELADKLEKNAQDNKDRLKKLSESISELTAGMKEFRAVKEDWDGMVDMSTKMVKRKRGQTKDAYERINDLNHQIGRELTKNYPYIPYEMLVDHQYAVSFPQTSLKPGQRKNKE